MSGWLNAEIKYEGFPLMLRRPATVERDRLQPVCTELLTVTHKFARRRPNGLPQPDYNNGLFNLDLAIQRAFSKGEDGTIVLIETFGGERNYYFYVSADVQIADGLNSIQQAFPDEAIELDVRSDPDWQFIDDYAHEFF